jgi:hypothetical protein
MEDETSKLPFQEWLTYSHLSYTVSSQTKAVPTSLTTTTIVVGTTRLPQPNHNIILIQIPLISRIHRDGMMIQDPLDLAALNADLGLAHDLGTLPNPHNQRKLHPLALCVIGILYAHIGVLCLRVVKLLGELGDSPRPSAAERQRITCCCGVGNQKPVCLFFVGAHGVIGGEDIWRVGA